MPADSAERNSGCRRRWSTDTTAGREFRVHAGHALHGSLRCDPAPEFVEFCQPVFRFVAGDQRGVDRADRGADDPVGLDAGFVQRLIDADLIGAERAAALQHQDDLAFGVGAEFLHRAMDHR